MEKQLSPYDGNIGYFAATEFGPNFFRFGMTRNGRSPYDRWKDADYNKCAKPSQFEHEFYKLGKHLDHEIHALLKATPGVKLASSDMVRSSEIFECEYGIAHAKALIEAYIAVVTGTASPIRQPLDPRPYQRNFVEQFKTTTGDFLLFAKCRAGKSAMTMLAIDESDYHSVLVVSYRTSAANSWRDDAAKYTVFHEWDVIDLADSNWENKIVKSQEANRRQLLVSTVQRQNERFGYLSGLSAHYPDGVDLLALDECHIGGNSEQFMKLRDGIAHGRLLEISGTAYKTIWKYPRENVFVWGYVEEQRAKAEGKEWAKKLPKMQLVLAKYDGAASASVYGDDPDALKNVFTVVDGKWQDAGSVQSFLRKFFAYGTMCRKQEQMLHDSQHVVMTLPSVEACYHFAQSLVDFGSPLVPLVITGESGNNQEDILAHVKANPATICLTRWANVVGVTVPEWDTVIHGCEYQSAEFWVQFAFRGGSTKRDSWKVIDFAPERAVQSIVEMATVTANVTSEVDPECVLRSLLSFADVFEFASGFEWLDYNNVLNMASASVSSSKAVVNSAVAATTVGDNVDALMWMFEGKDCFGDMVQLRESLNDNGTNGKGNKVFDQDRGDSKENVQALKKLLATIKAAVSKIDDVIAFELAGDVKISTLPQLLSAESFEMITDCHPDIMRAAMDAGWINERAVANATSQSYLYLSAIYNRILSEV